jgi:hypothetical protein
MSAGGQFDNSHAEYWLARLQAQADADRVAATVARNPSRRRLGRLLRTLRRSWWPRFFVAGVLLIVGGMTLLSGAAEAWVAGVGAVTVFVTISKLLSMSPDDYNREGPVAPGAPPPGPGSGWL